MCLDLGWSGSGVAAVLSFFLSHAIGYRIRTSSLKHAAAVAWLALQGIKGAESIYDVRQATVYAKDNDPCTATGFFEARTSGSVQFISTFSVWAGAHTAAQLVIEAIL